MRLKRQLLEELGTPWIAQSAGTIRAEHVRMRRDRRVTVPGIVLVDRGDRGVQRRITLPVEAGDQFMVLPYDAEVFFTPRGGEAQGPWQIEGGLRPTDGDPLTLDVVGAGAGQSSLDDSQQDALEALGYIQD